MSNQDVGTKNCEDTNAFTTAVGVVTGDIKLNVCSDLAWSLGCNDLIQQVRSLHFCWRQTQICYRVPYHIQDYQCPSR